jgi:hypothetical protein
MKLEIQTTDEATPLLAQLLRVLEDRRPLNAGLAAGLEALLRNHFIDRDTAARARTDARYAGTIGTLTHTGYWANKAQALESTYDADSARILIPLGDTAGDEEGREAFARYFGDVSVRAVNATYLTIPAQAFTYGHRAREYPDLHFIPFASGAKCLAKTVIDPETGKKKDVPYFWLLPSVTVPGDESVLPTDEEFGAMAEREAEAFIGRLANN